MCPQLFYLLILFAKRANMFNFYLFIHFFLLGILQYLYCRIRIEIYSGLC